MSFWGIDPEDWFSRRFLRGPKREGWFGSDMPRQFDEMRREMERMFEEEFKDIESKAPKELVREYQTPQGGKVREVGPIVYGYTATIGPDGKPRIREFGNVRPGKMIGTAGGRAELTSEREPLADVTTTDKEVKVVVEMPGISKQNIKVNAYDNSVEVSTDDPQRKYHRVIDLPPEANIQTARSKYNNGILEISFDKKKETKPKGKDIKVE
jgi:HSP20 family protein